MKRPTLLFALILSITVAASGCGITGGQVDETPATTTTAETAAAQDSEATPAVEPANELEGQTPPAGGAEGSQALGNAVLAAGLLAAYIMLIIAPLLALGL